MELDPEIENQLLALTDMVGRVKAFQDDYARIVALHASKAAPPYVIEEMEP